MLQLLSRSQQWFIHFMRVAIFIILAWIGGLKFVQYEADGIVPFVTNSPFMSFFYHSKSPEYKDYRNKEGELVPKNIEWHQQNNTYPFSYGLGIVIILIGVLTLWGIFNPAIGLIGGLLTAGMALITLSFLITTPETWVPDLGGPDHGFPFLSGSGRMVSKDIIMMAGGFICASDAATTILKRRKSVA